MWTNNSLDFICKIDPKSDFLGFYFISPWGAVETVFSVSREEWIKNEPFLN